MRLLPVMLLLGCLPLAGGARPAAPCANVGPPHDLVCGTPPVGRDESTIVIVGDIQELTKTRADGAVPNPESAKLGRLFDWIVASRESQHIELVLQVGDLVILGNCCTTKPDCPKKRICEDARWGNATAAFRKLDDARIPFAITRGNHDNPRSRFRDSFGRDFYLGLNSRLGYEFYLGTYDPDGLGVSHAWKARVAGDELLIVSLNFSDPRPKNLMNPDEVAWAQQKLDEHARLPAILLSHEIEVRSDYWREIVLPNQEQVFMTASGHTGNSHKVFFADGSAVLKTKQDWTWFYKPPLGRDFLTLVRFDRRAGSVRLLSYSPSLNQYTKLDPASRRQGVDRLAPVPFRWDVR